MDEDLTRFPVIMKDGRPTLATWDNGDCVFWKDGCGIWDKRPNHCRVFDCRPLANDPDVPWRIRMAAQAAKERS
jgi:Fe-S-cluster containining protein